MSPRAEADSGLSQRQAEIVGRQFNSAVTNTSAYGSGHPVSDRAYATFLAGLAGCLDGVDSLTLMLDRGSLFVEDYPVDAKFNASRLVILFRKLGLESLTFLRGIDVDDLKSLMSVLTRPDDFGDIVAVRDELARRSIESIRVNHVVLRKFTRDDEVIDREGLEELTGLAEQAVSSGNEAGAAAESSDALMSRLEKVFSMHALMQQPERMAETLLKTSTGAEPMQQAGIVDQIRMLGTRIERGGGAEKDESFSLDEVMHALAHVREEVSRGLAGQEETARLLAESGGVLSELDQLTCRTVVSIVRDEYRQGRVAVERLAQIIRRVLPDSRDLKRLLPMLKQALLDEGMPLGDYIEFVNQLTVELQSDQMVKVLEQGADSIGFSVDDLLREIRREPEEAARLIVLAAEMRQCGKSDESTLSSALSEYIERVSDGLVDAEPEGDRSDQREKIRKTRRELVDKVRAQGVPDAVAERMEADLDVHLDLSASSFHTGRLVELLNRSGAADDAELAEQLVDIVEREPNLSTLGDTLQRELGSHGYSAERIGSIYNETLARLRRRTRVDFIPGAVMSPVATNYFLKREIATCIRYDTFFSCIALMIAQVHESEHDWRTIGTEEIEALMPEVFDILPPHLRDLDLLGTFGSKDRNIPLVILPMTDETGAVAVMQRMLDALKTAHLELGGNAVKVNVIGTAARFDPERTSDAGSFVQWLKGRLATQLVTQLRSS
ncbi:MAG: hypothetical protein KGY48_01955 [Wenzhouxiangellaceae bacterium]|nr:hypothetical protein [Wenzhouxiangellaceae bacterium]